MVLLLLASLLNSRSTQRLPGRLAEGERRRIEESGPGPMGPTRMRLTKPVIAAVNDIETLTTNLSRKIWQKIVLIGGDRSPRTAD